MTTPRQRSNFYHSQGSSVSLFRPLLGGPLNLQLNHTISDKTPQVPPEVLIAINDKSLPGNPPTIVQKLGTLYKRYGVIIRPDNKYLIGWYVLIALIFIFYLTEIGLVMAFGTVYWQFELQYLLGLQIFFIVVLFADILISPLKTYYSQGILIKDINLILKDYLTIQIYIDLIAIFSITLPLIVGSNYVQVNWIKLLWLAKFYTMDKISEAFQRLTQLYIYQNTIFLVIKLILFSVFYGHFMAILFYLLSLYLYNTNYYGPNTPNIVWVYNSWAFYQMVFLQWYNIYAYILYYGISVVTTIAYGDITPKNPIECIFTNVVFVTQAIFWGYILSQILRLLINVYAYNFDRRYHHFALNYKLKQEMVSSNTFKSVQKHTQQIDKDQQYRNRTIQEQILNFLPADPLYGLLLVIHKKSLKRIGFDFVSNLNYRSLGTADSKSLFLVDFMKQIKEQRHFTGDLFYSQGQIQLSKANNHSAYFFTNQIYERSVVLGVGKHVNISFDALSEDYLMKQEKGSFKLCTVNRFFGNVQFLTGRERDHWAICSKNCLLFVVSREAFLASYYRLTLEEKESVALSIENTQSRQCLICQFSHHFLNCPYTFAIRRDERDQDIRQHRTIQLKTHDRTIFKKNKSWCFYPTIKQIQMPITHAYTQRLLYDKFSQDLFVEMQLQQKFDDQDANIEQQLHQTEIIINNLYKQQLEQLGLVEEHVTIERVQNYTIYKPEWNIDQVAAIIRSKRNKPRKALANLKNSFIIQSFNQDQQ